MSASGLDFIEWSWDPVPGADFYEVQTRHRRSDGSPPIFLDTDRIDMVTEPSYRLEDANEEHFLRVRSVSDSGMSDWSDPELGDIDLYNFDLTMWLDLVFDAHGCPTGREKNCDYKHDSLPIEQRTVRVPSSVPSFNIWFHPDAAVRFSTDQMDEIEKALRDGIDTLLHEQIGPITRLVEQTGVVNVIPVEGFLHGNQGWCGQASTTSTMHLSLHEDCLDALTATVKHELGHVMGFFHVRERGHLMHNSYNRFTDFSEIELLHMECAFELASQGQTGYTDDPDCPTFTEN